uniref:poly(A)-specific ribonuclease n=1 Tax=Strongyloides papillosus TaxID=174720 RepID=A0A0N5BC65_STREA
MTSAREAVKNKNITIIDVWRHNLIEEGAKICRIIKDYNYVGMDTEFPGVVATPVGPFRKKEDFNYQQVSCNVNMLKLIQVGLTFMNFKGELPPGNPVFQFNFVFDLQDDMYSTESIDLLNNCGINFSKHKVNGISMHEFGELLTTCGLLTDRNINWLTFSSGYDFGYLIRAVLTRQLPSDEKEFFKLLRRLFPTIIDIKCLLMQPGPTSVNLRGGLQEVAAMLHIERYGAQHQAGSDSLLTGNAYFALREKFFSDNWEEIFEAINGELYGLGNTLSNENSSTGPYRPTPENGKRNGEVYFNSPFHSNKRDSPAFY